MIQQQPTDARVDEARAIRKDTFKLHPHVVRVLAEFSRNEDADEVAVETERGNDFGMPAYLLSPLRLDMAIIMAANRVRARTTPTT